MNREAFKQRMQNLKSYREQNPGKGYWDFKSYEDGGYDAVSNRDWSGAGLAALGLVPFMPMTVKQFRSKYKGITPKTKSKGGYGHNFNTSVNKNITNNQLDNIINTSAEDLAKTY